MVHYPVHNTFAWRRFAVLAFADLLWRRGIAMVGVARVPEAEHT